MNEKRSTDLRMQIRPRNLRRIIDEMFAGNVSAVADRIGRPRSNLYEILRTTEGDRRGVGETLARDIERILGLDHLELDRSPDRPIRPDARALTETERDMVCLFRTLPEPDQHVIRALIESMADKTTYSGERAESPSESAGRRTS